MLLDTICQVEEPDYDFDRVRQRLRNIDNLHILPLDIDMVVEWSPAKEVWKLLKDDIMSSLWKHVHLSRLLRFKTWLETENINSACRLSWLWKFGGLYVDTDMLMLQEMPSSILDNSSFIALHNLHPDMGFSASIFQLSE